MIETTDTKMSEADLIKDQPEPLLVDSNKTNNFTDVADALGHGNGL